MNTVILSGRLTADVEIRYTPSGAAVGQFNLAVSRKYKQGEEWKEEVSFIGITCFGKQAENVAQYFKKGSPILVAGRLKQESWDDRDSGKKRSKTVVVMESFEFMSQKSDGQTSGHSTPPPARPVNRPTSAPVATTTNESDEDSVPF